VSLNIIKYNVFSDSSRGPDIYGTEPWDFYLRNLALNFGVWFPIAALAVPVVIIQAVRGRYANTESLIRTLGSAAPFYLWLGIFSFQPHKEERFMYPIYPFLALNTAISLHALLQVVGSVPKVPPMLKLAGTVCFFLASIILSGLRTASLASGYTAPLHVYASLAELAVPGDNVCLGKEWYRFPSSYFLPEGVKPKFIKSAFSGLLPGEFLEEPYTIHDGLPGAYLIPKGMNDENREDLGKYVSSAVPWLLEASF
jgi:alpha-1,2-mannosyltransferase